MGELVPDIIALLPVGIGAPLAVAFAVALLFRFIYPALRSAGHDDRLPFSKAVQLACSTFAISTIAVMLFLFALILYRLVQ